MANSINGIFGGKNYGVGGYVPQRKEEAETQNNANNAPVNNEQTQVDPDKIMEFMANNNYFVNPTEGVNAGNEVDGATQDRIANYMEQFEMIYGLVVEEFGERLAPVVMDYIMDYLMDMAA